MPAPQNRSEKKDPPRRNPAIHTMKSDVAEFFQEKKPSLANIVGLEVKRSQSKQQSGTNRRLFSISIFVLVLFVVGGAALWLFTQREAPPPTDDTLPHVVVEPTPFFATESEQTIEADTANRLSFLNDIEAAITQSGREDTIRYIRLLLRDGPQERLATFDDFLALYHITPPTNTFRAVRPPIMVFIHHGPKENSIGFALETSDINRTIRDLLIWEPALAADLRPLLPKTVSGENSSSATFEDRTYRNIDWRFLPLAATATQATTTATTTPLQNTITPEWGIGHMVFPARKLMVVTTSKQAMETVINRLFGTR